MTKTPEQIVIDAMERELGPAGAEQELRSAYRGITEFEIDRAMRSAAKSLRSQVEARRRHAAALGNILAVAKRGGLKEGEPVMDVIHRMAEDGDRDALNIVARDP